MTADAEHGRIEFRGLHRARVIDMLRLWSVARLAVDVHMLAALLLFQNVGVAVFASLVAGVVYWPSGDFGDGISAIVSILSETLRHQERTHSHKRQAADYENSGQSKEVPGIFEGIHKDTALSRYRSLWADRCALNHVRAVVKSQVCVMDQWGGKTRPNDERGPLRFDGGEKELAFGVGLLTL